jgi:filamentous hemagglutinin family protein
MRTEIIQCFINILVFFVCISFGHAQDSKIQVTNQESPLQVTNDTITIEENFGKQHGVNRFFTFDKFSIDNGQTALFKNDTGLENAISRVIGGDESIIDGTISSEFPNFYFLNPAGVIFGPHASLSIPGSFHVSTADYIRGKVNKFGTDPDTDLFSESNFFVDHPAAFGFLDASFGNIEIQGLGEYDPNVDAPGLSVNPEQTISLIGGDIEFTQGAYYYDNNEQVVSGTLYANAGRINIVSVKSAHEVPLQHIFKVDSISAMNNLKNPHTDDIAIVSNNDQKVTYQYDESLQKWIETADLTTIPGVKIGEINSQAEMGSIRANDRTKISVDRFTQSPDLEYKYQSRSGEIFIKGGQIFLDKTYILSQNCSDEQGGNIDIQAKSFMLKNDSLISTEVARDQDTNTKEYIDGKGKGGDIIISGHNGKHADSVMLFRSMISAGTKSLNESATSENTIAASGNIDIKARNISLLSTYQISDDVFETYEKILPESVYQKLSEIKNTDYSSKNAFVDAIVNLLTIEEWNQHNQIIMEGVQVGSSIFSDVNGYGKGGDITLDALESLNILGESQIFANAKNTDNNAGNAGKITINARTIILTEMNAEISSQTLGPGEGGDISLYADDSITINEFASIRAETGSSSSSSSGATKDNGNAGNILLDASRISILKGGIIESSTYVTVNDQINKGKAGNISIIADDLIHLSGEGVVDADASSIRNRCQNTNFNAGRGGKVKLTAREIKFEDGAFIGSETYGGGDGGDVELIASEKIHFSGTDNDGYACKIYTTSSKTDGRPDEVGKAGNIILEGGNLIQLKDGAGVTASTLGPGAGGAVNVKNTNVLKIIGGNPNGENEDGFASGLFARSEGQGSIAGSADRINIENVQDVIIQAGGVISTSTLGAGDAGEINLNLGTKLSITGQSGLVSEDNFKQSQRNYARMYSIKGDYRSGIYSSSDNEEPYAGDAGSIIVNTPSLLLDDHATLSTSTKGAGKAGNITINRTGYISMINGATVSSATFSGENICPDNLSLYERGGDITKDDLSIYYILSDLSDESYGTNISEKISKKVTDPIQGDIVKYSDNYYYYNGSSWIQSSESSIVSIINQNINFSGMNVDDIYKYVNRREKVDNDNFETMENSHYIYDGTKWYEFDRDSLPMYQFCKDSQY